MNAFPLIEVSGSPYELGYGHGAQAAPLIRRYLIWIEKLTGRSREILCRSAMAFLPAIRALNPLLVDEIQGLADGAGLSMDEAVLCQCRADAVPTAVDGAACTAFALAASATVDGHALAGQNQDLEPEFADVGIVLRVRPNDGRPRTVMFTFAGQIGYSGINEHGVAHFTNGLYNYRPRTAAPRYALKRVLLEQRSVSDCLALLESTRTSSAANLVLCDGAGQIADVEIRPEGVAFFPGHHPDARLHANHYLTPEFAAYESGKYADSPARLRRLRTLIEEHWGRLNVETLQAILADHDGDPAAICRHGGSGIWSISGYIADAARRVLHVRRGQGCTGTWTAYEV